MPKAIIPGVEGSKQRWFPLAYLSTVSEVLAFNRSGSLNDNFLILLRKPVGFDIQTTPQPALVFSTCAWTSALNKTCNPQSARRMPGPPNKRQKRDDYRKAQENLKVKRNAANAAPANGGGDGDGSGNVALPQKKFYRQRAHANPFSDHMLD